MASTPPPFSSAKQSDACGAVRPACFSKVGVQMKDASSTPKALRKSSQSSRVMGVRPPVNRCFTGTPARVSSATVKRLTFAPTAPGAIRASTRRMRSTWAPRTAMKASDSGTLVITRMRNSAEAAPPTQ